MARADLYRDHRTMSDGLRYAAAFTRETLHRREAQAMQEMFSDGQHPSGVRGYLGNTLNRIYRGPVFREWVEKEDRVGPAHSINVDNPSHLLGLCLLLVAEREAEMFHNLRALDDRCRVQAEVLFNNLNMEFVLYVDITVPLSLQYRLRDQPFTAPDLSRVSISVQQPMDTYDLGDGYRRAIASGPRTADISIGDVSLGQFTEFSLDENVLSVSDRENVRNEARALTNEQQLRNQERILEDNAKRQKQLAAAKEALDKPQGELKPRKTKRVSVDTEIPALEAESPRRLKLRRDRK